jgi:hypothetical protein
MLFIEVISDERWNRLPQIDIFQKKKHKREREHTASAFISVSCSYLLI